MSNVPSSTVGRSYRFEQTKRASGMPSSAVSERASSIAAGEKSAPVTVAPSRAHDRVSIPKWHWRWSSDRPATSPTQLDLVRPDPDPARLEAVQVVEVAGRVNRRSTRPRATG